MLSIILTVTNSTVQNRIRNLLSNDYQILDSNQNSKIAGSIVDQEALNQCSEIQRQMPVLLVVENPESTNYSTKVDDLIIGDFSDQELLFRANRLFKPRLYETNFSYQADWQNLFAVQDESDHYGKVLIDLSGMIVSVNQAFASLHGYKAEELQGQPIALLHPDSEQSAMNRIMTHIKTDGGCFFQQIDHRRRDGVEFQMLMSGGLVADKTTGNQYIIKTGIDLSANHLLDLGMAENQLHLIQNVIYDLNSFTHLNEFISSLLRHICNSTGWSYGEAWAFDSESQRIESDPNWYCSSDNQEIKNFRNQSVNFKFQIGESLIGRAWKSGKPEWISNLSDHYLFARSKLVEEFGFQSAVAIPITSHQETQMVLVFLLQSNQEANHELVELISMIAQPLSVLLSLQQAKFELKESNRLLSEKVAKRTAKLLELNQELESFSYSVSHDLRAPLRAIDGFSAILAQESQMNLSDKGKRYLQIIRDSIRQMSQLIEDLLSFAHMSRRDMTRTALPTNEMIESIIENLKSQYLDQHFEVKVHDLPMIYGDPPMMKQVFVNLLSNAFKYSSKKRSANIEVGFEEDEHETIFYVKDNGVGFDIQYAGKLFGVFQRLHGPQEYEGTGVGLSMVKRIITRHGGRVWADSQLNAGSTFYIALPKRKSNR